ncbi:MAG: PA14 domain-containing protein [Planctomycetota bacterium]
MFSGFVRIPRDGVYSFYTASDNGSRLYIGDALVVDNDGPHSMRERSGAVALKAGLHAVRVAFFQHVGDHGLEVRYQGPDLSKQLIPAEALYRVSTTGA